MRMIRRLRSLITYANVAATLAVFLAVAGGSAFALEGRNTVDSAVHVVGQRGEPALLNGGQGDCLWRSRANATPLPFNPPSFYKDPYGVVHLAGALTVVDGPGGDGRCDVEDETDDERIFVLPPGYRPARVEVHTVQGGPGGSLDGEDAVLIGSAKDVVAGGETLPAGTVFVAGDPTGTDGSSGAYFLDGISFRAATEPE